MHFFGCFAEKIVSRARFAGNARDDRAEGVKQEATKSTKKHEGIF
jgi:hypothetical protein